VFTLGFAVKTGAFNKMLPYLVAQVGGVFAGAVVVWLFYLPHWRATEDQAVIQSSRFLL
jgi:glycerol uptake facilitator protein